jgi:hypothetical protein
MVGAPLGFASSLAAGDPVGSTIGGLQTASLASGLLGGPTIGSVTTPALLAAYNALPGATAAGAEALGLTAGSAGMGLGGGAALGPFALMGAGALHAALSGGGDMFDAMFGTDRTHQVKQADEYKDYAEAFPDLAARRVAGANQFERVGGMTDPDGIAQALQTAASGAHANTEPAAWNLSHRPGSFSGHTFKPPDMSLWEAVSPTLGGRNAGAYAALLDKAQGAGMDVGGKVGDWNLNPAESAWMGEAGGDAANPQMANATGQDFREKIGYNNQAQFDDQHQWIGGDPGQSQEAQDLGNMTSGIGRALGINFDRGDGRDYQNFNDDQLAGYGMGPGTYGTGILNYLRALDPTIVTRPEWAQYTSVLGDPAGLPDLTLAPRAVSTYRAAPEPDLNLGGA